MNRQVVNTETKFFDSDAFKLTDLDSQESLMMIPCDTAGNFSWTGVTRAPLQRNAMQTSNTNNQYSDLEPPWLSIPQEDWTGGRGNLIFPKDTTRYFDGKRCQTSFNQVIYNGPLDYYSEGFRQNVYTNYPGNVHWKRMLSGQLTTVIANASSLEAGEIYILLRRRGTPVSPIKVGLSVEEGEFADTPAEITTDDITDTVSEFYKVILNQTITAESAQDISLMISTEDGTMDDHWEIGVNDDSEPYYRIAPVQDGYRSIFFMYEQLQFMIRQQPNGTPTLWINGDIRLTTGATDTTISSSTETDPTPWAVDQWKGARIGLVYGKGIEGQVSVWRTIEGNTTDTITVDKPWDVIPGVGCTYIIVDTPLWTQIETELLTTAVTDIEVVHGYVYICQGDYTPYIVMWWNSISGTFQFSNDYYTTGVVDTSDEEIDVPEIIETEALKATFIKSVRDSDGIMLWRARNDAVTYEIHNTADEGQDPVYEVIQGDVHNRLIDKSYLLDRDILTGHMEPDPEDEDDDGTVIYKWTLKKLVPSAKTVMECTYPGLDGVSQRTAEYADFYYPDVDFKQYKIMIGKFTTSTLNDMLTVTLQESPDLYDWKDVKSITCGCVGFFYLHAHCQHRYRRILVSLSGGGIRTIEITMGTSPVFESGIILKDNYGKIAKLFEYGAESYKNLWVFQEGMVSSVNKVDGTYTLDRINIDELEATAEEWNGSAVNTTDVYMLFSWLNGLQRYYNSQLEGKGPDHDEGLPFERQGRVTQFVSYPSNFFISIDGGAEGYSTVMQFNGSGWAELYRAPNKGEQIFDMAFQPIYGTRPDRLWVQVGDDVIWLAMPSKILYAMQDPNAEYTHESVMVSAWHTAGMMDIEKLWQSLKIIADNLDDTTCWIEADYQLDDEPEWYPIENLYIVSPSQKEDLNPYGSVNGKRLRYRLRLYTTDIHKSPKVNAVVLEAVGRVDIKWSYNFYFRNIKWKRDLNAEFEDLEPLEMQSVLDDWANRLKKLRLNSRWKIFDDKIVYLDAVQTSVLTELQEGYIGQITLNEL